MDIGKVNVNVKRKFKIGGREYNSVDEMPADIRETFEKAMASRTDSGHKEKSALIRTKINFNGTEYDSIDAMPKGVRELYETVLKAAETGSVPPGIDIMKTGGGRLTETKSSVTFRLGDMHRPTKTEPSFSMKKLVISALLAALVFLLYFLYSLSQGR